MTYDGGTDNFGIIYSVPTGSANLNTQYSFTLTSQGQSPFYNTFAIASNGKLYGTACYGGTNSAGVIYEYDILTNKYTKKFDFGSTNGGLPNGSMIVATNGKLYGLTGSGGASGNGVIYEYDPITNIFIKKFDFGGNTTGSYAHGNLLQAANGKLYGLTTGGGTNNSGVLFEYDVINDIFTKKLDFTGSATGSEPCGNLFEATNGKLYGLTTSGGASNNGVLFEYDPLTNIFIKKADFDGAVKGSLPFGSLIQANNGKLYGMSKTGGINNSGTIFEYDFVTDTLIKKIDFNGGNGKAPLGDLMKASNGLLYGMTSQGGSNNQGVIYEYDPSTNGYTLKFSFSGPGNYPCGNLVQAPNNKFYGVTNNGGLKNKGVIFEYDLSINTYSALVDFDMNINGGNPFGALLHANNNKLYGMTNSGGQTNGGIIFEYDPVTNVLIKKTDFDGSNKGWMPFGDLIQASNNKLYGITWHGGSNNVGVLFEYNIITSIFTKKLDFVSGTTGSKPYGSLLQANNNKLYGLTSVGGINNLGVLFEYDPATNIYTKKIDFNGTNGSGPNTSLIQASNGKLYGTAGGGVNSDGVLFEYDIFTNTLTKKVDFNGTGNGSIPYGDLVETNNKLYGLTEIGGLNNRGVLFEYDPATNTCTNKLDFNGTTFGGSPVGRLMLASNGKLYGNTDQGGTYNAGVLFEFDPITNNFAAILSYSTNTSPSDLIELCQAPMAASAITVSANQICAGSTVALVLNTNTIPGAQSYTWSLPLTASITSGAGTDSLNVDLSSVIAGVYTINVTGQNSCGNGVSSSINNVTVNALPLINTTIMDSVICIGQTTTLTANGANTYTWSNSSSGNNLIVSPTVNTTYTVTGTDLNGCNNFATITQSVSLCTGISPLNSPEKNSIKIYPNPATSFFNIEIQNYNSANLEVYNSVGQLVLLKRITEGLTSLDLSAFANGLYIVKIRNEDEIISFSKLVKSN